MEGSSRGGMMTYLSPIEFANNICRTTPIFIVQGTGDGRVTTPKVFDLAKKFYELKQPFRLSLFEGGGHNVREFKPEMEYQIKTFLIIIYAMEKNGRVRTTLIKRTHNNALPKGHGWTLEHNVSS